LHVDAVNVRAFLTVNFYVYEVGVHQRGGFRVFERFVRHDMTPMTGGVSDAQEDGLIFHPGFGQRFFSPRMPVYRVVGVLEEIGGCFVYKMIWHEESVGLFGVRFIGL